MSNPSPSITAMIDHTLLKADAGRAAILKLAEEAKQYGFASVCVNPTWVKTAAEILKDSPVKVCTVIGFPLGASAPEVKAFEAAHAIAEGAGEVDMVINIGALKDGDDDFVRRDIAGVVQAAAGKALVKVIIETCLLTDEEIVRASKLSVEAGADFVKTSTGFSTGGATVEAVELMRKTVGPDVGVKASGGVRSLADAEAMIKAGATRLGTSAGVAIAQGQSGQSSY
ncbi:deoxyribose-phosphate aldolase [Paenibacillus sp. HMSSN-139]|nr:deoxyribose-phosphate aldolase [Paenibacillus sp. HMSSN-139]